MVDYEVTTVFVNNTKHILHVPIWCSWLAIDNDGTINAYEREPISLIDVGKWHIKYGGRIRISDLHERVEDWEEMCWCVHMSPYDYAMQVLG